MKSRRYISIIVALLTIVSFVSCEKTYLTELNNRIDKIEGQDVTTPKLTSLQFLAHDNVESLIVDVDGEIVSDSIVECWSHHMMKDKILTPSIMWVGATLFVDDVPHKEGQSYDFKRPVKLSIVSSDSTKYYTVYMHAFTGLPIMEIVTENRQDVTSKEEYLRATLTLKENVGTRAPGDVIY